MNCNNFEAIISDLAREQILEATLRQQGLSHIEECEECRAHFEMERALTTGLRAFSASMANREAPAQLEANLLAKFRERAETLAERERVVVAMPQKTWRTWYPHAAAAAILIMFAIGGAFLLGVRHGQAPISQPNLVATNSNKIKNAPPQTASTSTPLAQEVNTVKDQPVPLLAAERENTRGGQKLSKSEVAALLGTSPAPQRRNNVTNVPKQSVKDAALTSDEIATDFMPVSYGENLNAIDSGRIVRVEMPRSALAQFGLPVNMDRANERVKADVLIGDDGMARAIRFVR